MIKPPHASAERSVIRSKKRIHGVTLESSETKKKKKKKGKTAITQTIISHLQKKFSHFPTRALHVFCQFLLEYSISYGKLHIAQGKVQDIHIEGIVFM